MPERQGRYTLDLNSRPGIAGYACVSGAREGAGPMGGLIDFIYDDVSAGEKSWEKAESIMHGDAVARAISKAGISPETADIIFAGDLLGQCMGTTFGIRDKGIPFFGVYGACSTMALSLAAAALSVDTGAANIAVASTSSHFCSAEKQFRMPLEYGGQRPPTAQRTVTGSGAVVISKKECNARVEKVIFGRIQDYGVKDANNMGAGMAPAACRTIADFLNDTGTTPSDYDMILTGDLGAVGSKLLCELMLKQENIDISAVHKDCGLMIYDISKEKDVASGGSGCGCSAVVLCSDILKRLEKGELKSVLFVGTGALLSAVSPLQSESIPSIAHGVLLSGGAK